MTSRERMIAAFANKQPDMVPVCPDISNMVPCRLTGKPFWDIYMHGDPPLWKAYIDAVRYFGFDGWYPCMFGVAPHPDVTWESQTVSETDERIVTRSTMRTPDGDLWQELTFYRADPPTITVKPIKEFPRDIDIWLKYSYPDPGSADGSEYLRIREAMGEDGVVGPMVTLPGFQDLFSLVDGGLEAVTYAYMDYPELFDRYEETNRTFQIAMARHMLAMKPDFLQIGCSGLLTLQSPDILRHLSLPTIKAVTAMAKEAGVPTNLHSCGKESLLVEMCANETDLTCIEPLEIAPMGDCDLAELKARFGHKIAFKGNIHTTDVMLNGTADDVRRASRQCIDDAAKGGGFILATGDQCGRDTPDENLFAMVEVARSYGVY